MVLLILLVFLVVAPASSSVQIVKGHKLTSDTWGALSNVAVLDYLGT